MLKKTSLERILEAVEAQKYERGVKGRLGIFVPPWAYPSTWLNEERWDNEVMTEEELKTEAQMQWGQKMSYRDRVGVQQAIERNERRARLQARYENSQPVEYQEKKELENGP